MCGGCVVLKGKGRENCGGVEEEETKTIERGKCEGEWQGEGERDREWYVRNKRKGEGVVARVTGCEGEWEGYSRV